MIDEVQGLKNFTDHFRDYNEQFVIIGGVATNYFLIENDLMGRRTRDIDLVVLANPNIDFADRLRGYINAGRFQIESDSGKSARNYRFRHPEVPNFPKQIEIFSRVPISLILREGQQIVPFTTSPNLDSLSAILMNEDYFSLVSLAKTIKEGMPLLTSDGLIPLKVRAFLDLNERRQNGEQIDIANIKKHRNDVFRLSQTLGVRSFTLPESIKDDLKSFVNSPELKGLDSTTISSIVPGINSIDILLQLLSEHFEL